MTVGVVIVSHSARLAEGVVELAREMVGQGVPIEAAGGLDEPGEPLGTDAVRVMAAIERVTAGDGEALVLMDLGSAVLSAETALDLLDDDVRGRTLLCAAPLIEGAVAAAAAAGAGATLEEAAREARGGLAGKEAHLGAAPGSPPPAGAAETGGDWEGVEAVTRDVHGLHARPAAALVRVVAAHSAEVRVRNLSTGAGPASARSLTALSALGALAGHRLLLEARGPDSAEVLAAVQGIIEEGGGPSAPTPTAAVVPERPPPPASGDILLGTPASPGLGSGPARVRDAGAADLPATADDPAAERVALTEAIAATARELQELRATADRDTAEIIGAELLILDDTEVLGAAEAALAAGASAAGAWDEAVRAAAAAYERLNDPYLRARGADVLDVGRRVVGRLVGSADQGGPGGVVVAAELGAAEVAALDPDRVAGIAMSAGGPTSHAAIIARTRGIPAVTGLGAGVLAVAPGTELIVDGGAGTVVVDPSDELLARHHERVRDERRRAAEAVAHAHEPATTRDGVTIEVAANIGAPGDLEAAADGGADGVGLLRTEFLFLGRAREPVEDDQYAAYVTAVRALEGRRLVLRTLDAGADKPLAYLAAPAEDNPFLGVRGVRLSLSRPGMLLVQLRAALRAAAEGPVSVMFPMISERAELLAARALVEQARESLRADGLPAGEVELGAMVEVPAAALLAGVLAAEVEFLSIGTNDLVQYTMAAERGNAGVAYLSDALHPAVLRLIATVTAGAAPHGCRVAVCGEAASDPLAVPLLIGLGVDELSVAPRRVAAVKERVRALSAAASRALAEHALTKVDAASVRELVSAGTVGG